MQGIIRNSDPIRQINMFCPVTRTFNIDESRRASRIYTAR